MHPKLINLTVKGFRSFDDTSSVVFPENGLVLLAGKNNDTGGSSGSGKSSLLLALSYLLGYCKYPSTALQSWNSDSMQVTGTFSVEEGTLVVSRGKKFSVSLNGTPIEGAAKDLEAAIVKHIGLSPELISALSYRGQKSSGLFLSKGDSAKKEFLTTVLGLERFEKAVEDSKERAKNLELEALAAQSKVNTIANLIPVVTEPVYEPVPTPSPLLETALAFEKVTLAEAASAVTSAWADIADAESTIGAEHKKRLVDLAAEVAAINSAPINVEVADTSEIQAKLVQAKAFLAQLRNAEQSAKAAYMERVTTLKLKETTLKSELREAQAETAKGLKLLQEIAEIESGKCNTCHQDWITEGAVMHVEELREQFASLKNDRQVHLLEDDLAGVAKTISQLQPPTPDANIPKLEEVIASLTSELATKEQEAKSQRQLQEAAKYQRLTEVNNRKLQLDAAYDAEMNTLRMAHANAKLALQEASQKVAKAEAAINEEANKIQILSQRNALNKSVYEQAVKNKLRALENLKVAEVEYNEVQTKLKAEHDFAAAIGREGFLGAIFDEVLDEISTEVNTLLGKFPNTAHVSLRFVSEAETKKGSIKKSIVPIVTVGGNEAPLSSGLSGGMETAVELAVDLAVAEVVSRRSGVMPGWLILDEAFTGLGPVEAEACMEILAEYAQDRLVLVVDHASETKEHFTNVITVEYSNGSSKVLDS